MPVITISGPENVSKETKKEIIEKTSKVVAEAYGLPIQTITVIIQENSQDNIGVAGQQLSERVKK
ncbi:MAG: 2-hydroxymuconate tautomerase family protein [Methanosphaera sp.]|nr:2-hydroxymuconate tautomerase family protein [Methanosphaera sp.]